MIRVLQEKISWFSYTANINRKTVPSSGIWTRTFGNIALTMNMLQNHIWSHVTTCDHTCSHVHVKFFVRAIRRFTRTHRSQWLDSSTGRADWPVFPKVWVQIPLESIVFLLTLSALENHYIFWVLAKLRCFSKICIDIFGLIMTVCCCYIPF